MRTSDKNWLITPYKSTPLLQLQWIVGLCLTQQADCMNDWLQAIHNTELQRIVTPELREALVTLNFANLN